MKKMVVIISICVLILSVGAMSAYAKGNGTGECYSQQQDNDASCDNFNLGTQSNYTDEDKDGVCDNLGNTSCGNCGQGKMKGKSK